MALSVVDHHDQTLALQELPDWIGVSDAQRGLIACVPLTVDSDHEFNIRHEEGGIPTASTL